MLGRERHRGERLAAKCKKNLGEQLNDTCTNRFYITTGPGGTRTIHVCTPILRIPIALLSSRVPARSARAIASRSKFSDGRGSNQGIG